MSKKMEKVLGCRLRIDDSEKSIKDDFKIWILTYAPSYELIVKKWYDNFISCSLSHKISYLKLVTKLVQMKRNNLQVTQAIFFDKLKLAFVHISKLSHNSKLLNMITQVISEWKNKYIFTVMQVKELQDLIISRKSNDSGEDYYGALPLRVATQRRKIEVLENCEPPVDVEAIQITKQNFSILKNHVTLLKHLVIDLHENFTEEKYYSVKTFFQATLQNINSISEENNASLDFNRNLLAMLHKIIKYSKQEEY